MDTPKVRNRWCMLSVVVWMFVTTADAQEIFIQAGTQGPGIGGAITVTQMVGLHADFNAISFHHDFTVSGIRYKDDVDLRQGGLYLDLFPFRASGFRMTAGVRFNDDHLTGTSAPTNGAYVFEGKTYPAFPGEYAVAEVRYPTVMPYFGIGYGHHQQTKGWGLIADLGVAYGIPEVSYTLSPALTQKAGPAMSLQIASDGLNELRSKVSPYRWYPVLQIGVSYRF
ncbi:hypothetical protein [Paraburkholderia hospita]|uniref:hypothetical protein n=1 Tax=Paraburkholderia hospita TaxID=169430 RepID=UPI000271941A|nr:hypothetical protein [Paraburkholderia hospita]EUC14758.1 hypothetical protein PMI06_006584 [Burkholderia sp. BT03]SKC93988.1 hypothetical protein SAMN06266956_5845 [Paraburkholderia hospita]